MWSVRSRRAPGFRRSGLYFAPEDATLLTDEQMTDAIRNEPMLIVEQLADGASAATACEATTAKGEPCKGKPMSGSHFCLKHQPR